MRCNTIGLQFIGSNHATNMQLNEESQQGRILRQLASHDRSACDISADGPDGRSTPVTPLRKATL